MKTIVMSEDELKNLLITTVRDVVQKELPEAFRRAQVPEWLLPAQVEREFQISRRSLQYLRDTKKIKFRKIGKRVFFHRDDIESFIASRVIGGET